LKGIDLANDCDLKYRSSKNQRLLVELTLMQLASITFDGEKKNNKHYIIPPSYFEAKGIKPIKVKEVKNTTQANDLEEKIEPAIKEPILEPMQVAEPKELPKISIDKGKKATSGLSLKSIREKKEHQIKQLDVIIDEESLPREPVTQENLKKAWTDYTKRLEKKGEKILASILQMENPKLKGTSICLTYSNNTSKIEVERAQYPLLVFLKKTLKNYDLKLDITVNEEIAKKYAFTPQEKYEKLKEKNTNIELLKRTFGLDI
jgi:DNA polymerase-3 subunit gamma/tau